MMFWILSGAGLVVLLALAWWSDRRKRGRLSALSKGSRDALAAQHQADRGRGTLQGQHTRDTFNGPYGG